MLCARVARPQRSLEHCGVLLPGPDSSSRGIKSYWKIDACFLFGLHFLVGSSMLPMLAYP